MNNREVPDINETVLDGFDTVTLIMQTAVGLIRSGAKLGIGCSFPSCHAVARAVQRFVPNVFDVVDGFIPVAKARVEGEEILADVIPMDHSWLVFKEDRRFIADVVPLGSVPLFSSPVLIYLDENAPEYMPRALSGNVSLEEIERNTERMWLVLGEEIARRAAA